MRESNLGVKCHSVWRRYATIGSAMKEGKLLFVEKVRLASMPPHPSYDDTMAHLPLTGQAVGQAFVR